MFCIFKSTKNKTNSVTFFIYYYNSSWYDDNLSSIKIKNVNLVLKGKHNGIIIKDKIYI